MLRAAASSKPATVKAEPAHDRLTWPAAPVELFVFLELVEVAVLEDAFDDTEEGEEEDGEAAVLSSDFSLAEESLVFSSTRDFCQSV